MEVHYEGGNRELMETWLGTGFSYRAQKSGDIGVRMERAFSACFEEGASRAVIVGTDCPGITMGTVRAAFDLLSQFDLVIGPAKDGGYYLIGLCHPQPRLFSNIPWGTAEVQTKTLRAAERLRLRVAFVDLLIDVDRPEDLEVWEQEAAFPKNLPTNISAIVPTLNEEKNIMYSLESVQNVPGVEVIVVDGGSVDGTVNLVRSSGVRLLIATAGRAGQVNVGAAAANGDVLLFLHADTRLPAGFDQHVLDILARPDTVAGAFELGIEGEAFGLRIIETLANFRSRFFQLPYGDQAIFVKAALFHLLGGFPEMPIMEDYAFMRRVKRHGRVALAPALVGTSARRWLKLGILRTTLINQAVILGYYLGVEPGRLARWYRRIRH
jgi:rSAM/selenodomain-associated transferase 2/rSAM/selenodomain-associated transferase 1